MQRRLSGVPVSFEIQHSLEWQRVVVSDLLRRFTRIQAFRHQFSGNARITQSWLSTNATRSDDHTGVVSELVCAFHFPILPVFACYLFPSASKARNANPRATDVNSPPV